MSNEQEVEQMIQDKGLDAPRLAPADIDAAIVKRQDYRFPGTNTMVVCLTLKNGYTVTGESACVSSANFDAEVGGKVAFDNARDKIWQLEGYRLKCELDKTMRDNFE